MGDRLNGPALVVARLGAEDAPHDEPMQVSDYSSYVRDLPAHRANAKSFYPRALLASWLAKLAPYDMLNRRRAAIYRACGFTGIGRNVLILGSLRILGQGDIYSYLRIGEDSAIAAPCMLTLYAPLTIGRRVHFGPDVTVLTGTHQIGPAEERCGEYRFAPVTIGDGTWVGTGAIILPNVTIGSGCVISSGAVVTRDVPDNMLVVGNPARPVQKLDTTVPSSTNSSTMHVAGM